MNRIFKDTKSGVNTHGLAILGGLMFGLFHVGYDQVFYTFVPQLVMLAFVVVNNVVLRKNIF